MCGIAGFIDFTKATQFHHLKEMTDTLTYRGPDASGYELFKQNTATVGLGHRRLSIIDLSPLGKQPMFTADNKLVIIFNGEIYNYKEVKRELENCGHAFTSGSDTEVILSAYRQWGTDAIHKFTGMFVFALYDTEKQIIFFARDRAGVKPLYYYWDDHVFLFASELKAFFKHPSFRKIINEDAVHSFLALTYVPAPNSIFKNCFKLEPGHILELNLSKKNFVKKQYWNVLDFYSRPKISISENDALIELESTLKTACEYRMVSDVPVGLFLSGGYDSTLVAALLQNERTEKIKTFTIGFAEKQYDEAVYAREVAKHLDTDHHELYCTDAEAKAIIPDLPFYYDEPFGDSSAIPTILVSRFARNSVTVALSADGGDETFAGYTRHLSLMNLSQKKSQLPEWVRKTIALGIDITPSFLLSFLLKGKNADRANLNKYRDFLKDETDLVDMISDANRTMHPKQLEKIVKAPAGKREFHFDVEDIRNLDGSLDRLLAFDYLTYLSGDILTKVDRAGMSVSLEGREPLLDNHLIEWMAVLPDQFKIRGAISKYLVRKIVHKYVPNSLMERPKMGFSIPLKLWFRKDLRYLFDEYLSKEKISKHNFLDFEELQKCLAGYYKGNDCVFPFLWSVLMLQMWYEKWM